MSLNSNEVVIRHLEEQLSDFTCDLKKSRTQTQKLRGYMSAIAEKVCDSEYGKSQLGGENLLSTLDDIALKDFIIKNVLKQRINFTKNIVDLQKMYLQEQQEKNDIAKQLLDERKEKEQYQKAYENLIRANESSQQQYLNSSNEPTNAIPVPIPVPMPIKQEGKDGEMVGGNPDLVYYNKMPYDINDVYNQVDVYQMKMLEIIGNTGYSETNDIVDSCTKAEELGGSTMIRDNLKTMVNNALLETESISTPIRKKLTLYSITPIGRAIYRKEFGKMPVKDEKTKIKEMHATLPHGYCIKDTVKILGDLGYTNISMDASRNAIEVANNRRYVPDIVANFDAKTKTYWEVELGHHHDGDFFEKLEKAAKVTSTVYIVVNDAQTWEVVKKQVVGFKLKLKQEHRTIKLTVLLGTMNQLSKKNVFFDNPENKFILG